MEQSSGEGAKHEPGDRAAQHSQGLQGPEGKQDVSRPPKPGAKRRDDPEPPGPEKLQKLMAAAGIASRRACEELIAAGKVKVDGKVASLGDRADGSHQVITVDGRPLRRAVEPVFIMLHKPRGCITSAHDPQGRPTVLDLVREVKARVYPVGRLDYDSEGLVLLTNDGAMAQALTHPSFETQRSYLVKVQGTPSDDAIGRLRTGVELEDGRTSPTDTRLVRREGSNAWLRIRMHEGRNRQVRRMCDAVGHPVLRLRRVQHGPLRLEDLPVGRWRHLTTEEIRSLRHEFT